MDRILGGIYVGSFDPIVEHVPLKAEFGITHILSVMKFEVLPQYLVRKGYSMKNIPIDDVEDSDIIQYIDESNKFIDDCLFPDEEEYDPTVIDFRKKPQKSAVYIHCNAGVSRSVSFAVAYLMYRYRLPLKSALHAVKRKHPVASPNDSFMEQLAIYEEMGFNKVDYDHEAYREWKQRHVTQNEVLADEKNFKDETHGDSDLKLRCKKCRQHLAQSSCFIDHVPPSEESRESLFMRRSGGRVVGIEKSQDICSHYFVEPLNWMKEELMGKQELEGKLNCPKCKSRVGEYNWKGSRCSCGKWMVPAIYLQKAKIDEIKSTNFVLPNAVKFVPQQ